MGFDIPNAPGTDPSVWTSSITTPLATTATPAFPFRVKDALDQAAITQDKLEDTDTGLTEDVFQLFKTAAEALGGDADVSIPSLHRSFLGYQPLRARWLRSQWGFGPGFSPFPKEKLFSYQDPNVFQEIRERGARLYCAARAAQFEQGNTVSSLGQRAAFSVNVLGQQIDFLVMDSMMVLDGPERFTASGANDGAQAFEIPLQLGTRITPISFLDGFDEIRAPLALVTGDSEVTNQADTRDILVGWNVSCSAPIGFPPIGKCTKIPFFVHQPSEQYQTVTHVDALLSADKAPSLTAHFTLFFLGPVKVVLGIEPLQLTVGKLSAENTRVLDLPLPGWPAPRTGRLFENPQSGVQYHDGRWALRLPTEISGGPPLVWFVEPDGETNPFWRAPFHLPFVSPPPLDVRLFNDDDRAVVSTTGLQLNGTLAGVLGGSFGPFDVNLTVKGGINGMVNNDFVIREALRAAALGGSGMTPLTGLSIRPRMRANATLDETAATLHLSLHIDLGITSIDIDITQKLLSIPSVSLASYNSDSALTKNDEQYIFRLGTGSRDGDVMKQPAAVSHLPGHAEFNSFDIDVDSCLADDTPNPPTPPPCQAIPASAEPPSAQICAYGPALAGEAPGPFPLPLPQLPPLPPGVCASPAAYVAGLGLTPAQSDCVGGLLGFLCTPVSQQQAWNGKSVVSKVLDLTNPAQGEALAYVAQICVQSFLPPGALELPDDELKQVADSIANSLVQFGICTSDATLLSDDEVIGALTGSTPPPLMPGPPCQQGQ